MRIIADRPDLMLAPVGLIRVRAADVGSDFLGFSVNVQTPLEYQRYASSPLVLSSAVSRPFESASIVILDACGISEPGASRFIEEFNFRGMSAAIATSTRVEPTLAGEFPATFMNLLEQHMNDPHYTVSQARFDAVRALGRGTNSAYGAKALAFILAGNGALRLCVPPP